jgi:anti-sigma factor RsiW
MESEFQKNVSGNDQHERYVELCALAATGSLTPSQREQLDRHLATCAECCDSIEDFDRVVRVGIPLLAESREEISVETPSWSQAEAKQRVFAQIDREEHNAINQRNGLPLHPTGDWSTRLAYVVAGLICLSLLAGGYLAGVHSRPQVVQIQAIEPGRQDEITLRIAQVTKEKEVLAARADDRARVSEELSHKIAEQSRELEAVKKLLKDGEATAGRQIAEVTDLRRENTSLRVGHDGVSKKLKDTEAALSDLQQELNRAQAERVDALLKAVNAEEKLKDLVAESNARQSTVAEQQKLLVSDPDIREILGARDLLMADVYDNDKDGRAEKAFGRIFYTKNKSLVFYAFDLDKMSAAKNAKTFEAWGEDGTTKGRPVNLGTFYMDNEANRRWVFKLDNPEIMRRINAVFVTVEPKAGSKKPSGEQRLYTYLRTPPNHP